MPKDDKVTDITERVIKRMNVDVTHHELSPCYMQASTMRVFCII